MSARRLLLLDSKEVVAPDVATAVATARQALLPDSKSKEVAPDVATANQNLVVVRRNDNRLNFLILDSYGRLVVDDLDDDESRLPLQPGPLADLKTLLAKLWPSRHELSGEETAQVISLVERVVYQTRTMATYKLTLHMREFTKEMTKQLGGLEPLSLAISPDHIVKKMLHDLRVHRDEIERAEREFNAKLFFVLVFGALKSGKSTLVNALSRSEISPSEFGRETTRRPVIIMHSTANVISRFLPKRDEPPPETLENEELRKKANEERRGAFNLVIDYLRGTIDSKNNGFRDSVEIDESFELNSAKLHKAIAETDQQNRRPLMVAIQSSDADYIEDDIAVIDMPGIDGFFSSFDKDVVNQAIVERADFLLFIQSLMAPLNQTTGNLLNEHVFKKVMQEGRRPPLWLILNEIDARPWRTPESRTQDTRDLERTAAAHISDLLHVREWGKLGQWTVNLGKAIDGILNRGDLNEDANKLVVASGFNAFVEELKRTLKQDRFHIREAESLKQATQAIAKFRKDLVKSIEDLRKCEIAIKDSKGEMLACANTIRGLQYNFVDKIYKSYNDANGETLEDICTSHQKQWTKDMTEACNAAVNPIPNKHKTKDEDLNRLLNNLSIRCANLGQTNFGNSQFKEEVRKRFNEEANTCEKRVLSAVNATLTKHGREEIRMTEEQQIERFPNVDTTPFPFVDASKWRRGLWKFGQKYNRDEVTAEIKIQCTDEPKWPKVIESRVEGLRENLSGSCFKDYGEQRKKQFLDALDKEVRRFLDEIKPVADLVEKMRDLLNSWNRHMTILVNLAPNDAGALRNR